MLTICLDIKPDTKIRFLLPDADPSSPFRALMWIKVCSDGSVLTGLSNQDIVELRLGRPQATGTGASRVTYGEGMIVRKEDEDNFYLSFHSTGAINLHLPDQPMRKGRTLRSLEQPAQLCIWIFQDPNVYPPVSIEEFNSRNVKTRNHDVPITLPPYRDRPLQAHVYVGPADQAIPIQIEGSTLQSRYIMRCKGIKGMQDSFVQVIFGHTNAPAPVPPETHILWHEADLP
jgi:hypothetical protein